MNGHQDVANLAFNRAKSWRHHMPYILAYYFSLLSALGRSLQVLQEPESSAPDFDMGNRESEVQGSVLQCFHRRVRSEAIS